MPFCTVWDYEVDPQFINFFDGFIKDGGDIIYAAVKVGSSKFENYRLLEPFDVRGGRALYEMPDFLAIFSPEHYDIAVYRYKPSGLCGFVETKSGKVITPAQFSEVQPFYSQKYAQACYPDGQTAFIDTAGQPLSRDGYNYLLDVYAFHCGVFFARKRSAGGTVSCGAIDADGKVFIDFVWDTLSLCVPVVEFEGYAVTKNGRYFILDEQGRIAKDCGDLFDGACEFHKKGINYWWSFTVGSRPGLLWNSGAYWILTENAEEHEMHTYRL